MENRYKYTKEDYKKFIHTLVDDLDDFYFIKVIYSVIARECQRAGS